MMNFASLILLLNLDQLEKIGLDVLIRFIGDSGPFLGFPMLTSGIKPGWSEPATVVSAMSAFANLNIFGGIDAIFSVSVIADLYNTSSPILIVKFHTMCKITRTNCQY
jgi:hypothetical protein